MTDSGKIFDGLLVLQYRAGKKKALGLLVRKYHKRLCKHSYWYTNDIDASKDIVQDCWGSIITKLDSLKEPNFFGSWAFRIVTRKSLDYVKRRKKERGTLKEYYSSQIIEESKIGDNTDVLKLGKAIQNLTKDQQMVLRLFYTESYSLNEVSDILGISIGTVKSRLFHAREKLKTFLKK
ncbi:RNA polymerase sigma factor [Maribacter sp. 2308TA10-17]|uniref:RNA polymerase sigma factor n=1 Tax=Maribacter sp. 2308TA10-17 TaxID=3386276 RepID=UPI0039BD4DF0